MNNLRSELLEKIDEAYIASFVLSRLGLKFSSKLTARLFSRRSAKLNKVISSIEKIESKWVYKPKRNKHTFGRKELNEIVRLWSVPQKSAEVLRNLVILTEAKTVLETGTSAGYSTLHLAEGAKLNNGGVFTIEILDKKARLANKNFERSGLDNIQLLQGEASDILCKWSHGKIDFVFLDADKESYGKYLDQLLPLMRVNGLIFKKSPNASIKPAPELGRFIFVPI